MASPAPSTFDRLVGLLGGLAGAAGVAASAAAAHAYRGTPLETVGPMLLVHAAALIALSGSPVAAPALRRLAAAVMVVGLAIFCGDLALRTLAGRPLFPLAAPTGGILLIAAWLAVAVAFVTGRRG